MDSGFTGNPPTTCNFNNSRSLIYQRSNSSRRRTPCRKATFQTVVRWMRTRWQCSESGGIHFRQTRQDFGMSSILERSIRDGLPKLPPARNAPSVLVRGPPVRVHLRKLQEIQGEISPSLEMITLRKNPYSRISQEFVHKIATAGPFPQQYVLSHPSTVEGQSSGAYLRVMQKPNDGLSESADLKVEVRDVVKLEGGIGLCQDPWSVRATNVRTGLTGDLLWRAVWSVGCRERCNCIADNQKCRCIYDDFDASMMISMLLW